MNINATLLGQMIAFLLFDAECQAKEIVCEARQQAVGIVDQAQLRAGETIEEAKSIGAREGDRMIRAARDEIEQEATRASDELRKEVAAIALAGAEKLLEREIDDKTHKKLLDKLAAEI